MGSIFIIMRFYRKVYCPWLKKYAYGKYKKHRTQILFIFIRPKKDELFLYN